MIKFIVYFKNGRIEKFSGTSLQNAIRNSGYVYDEITEQWNLIDFYDFGDNILFEYNKITEQWYLIDD
jgi:hypothetical protein